MPSQRVTLGIGFAILLIISAASIGLDVRSRSETGSVDRTLTVLKRISDLRPLLRGAESAARGFALTGEAGFVDEYRNTSAALLSAFDDLIAAVRDNSGETQLVEETKALVAAGIAADGELIRLRSAGDKAGIETLIARPEGRAAMEKVGSNIERLTAEERRRLAERSARYNTNGRWLLAIDLAGVVLILVLAMLLIGETRRSGRELRAANEKLEAAVAERTEHLVVAHEALRQSTTVLESTFHSMAEAVLVIDANGKILLSNPAAENMLYYKPGMTVELLGALSTVFQADGVTPLPASELPAARALRGEQFDNTEIIARPRSGNDPVHLVISGRPLRDASGAINGAALVYHDISASRDTERRLLQSQKLDAIGKLTGGVAHDINNMLTVITGTSGDPGRRLQEPAVAVEDRRIDRSGPPNAARELIQHLLAFARRQPLRAAQRRYQLDGARYRKIASPDHRRADRDLVRSWKPARRSPHVDPSQLAHSVLNLAVNARDAMPNGGHLIIETGNLVLDEDYAEATSGVKAGPYVMLAVSDTGTGMPRRCRKRFSSRSSPPRTSARARGSA